MHGVDQRPNLSQLCELLGGTEGLIETVGFKKTTLTFVVGLLHVCFCLCGSEISCSWFSVY